MDIEWRFWGTLFKYQLLLVLIDLNLWPGVRVVIRLWLIPQYPQPETDLGQNYVDYRVVFVRFFFTPPPRVKTLLWYQQIMSESRLSAVIGWAHLRIMRSGYKGLEQHEHESITAVTAVGHMFTADSLVSISRIRLHDFCVISLRHISLMLSFCYLLIHLFIREGDVGWKCFRLFWEELPSTYWRPQHNCDQLSTLTSTSKHPGLGSRRAQVCACVCPRA